MLELLTDLRKAARVAWVVAAVSWAILNWRPLTSMLALRAGQPSWGWAILASVPVFLAFDALTPVFYFVLARDRSTILFTPKLRRLALAGAMTMALFTLIGFWAWVASWASYWRALSTFSGLDWRMGGPVQWAATRGPATFTEITLLAAMLSNGVSALVLLTLCGHVEDETRPRAAASRELRVMAKVAAIALGVWTVWCLVRVVMIPFTVPPMLRAATGGVDAWILARAFLGPLSQALSGAALFVAPYVILKGTTAPEAEERQERAGEPARW